MFCNFDKIEENHCFSTGLPPSNKVDSHLFEVSREIERGSNNRASNNGSKGRVAKGNENCLE